MWNQLEEYDKGIKKERSQDEKSSLVSGSSQDEPTTSLNQMPSPCLNCC